VPPPGGIDLAIAHAAVAARVGDSNRAARLWGALEALEAELGRRLIEAERARYEHSTRVVRGRHADAVEEGRRLGLAEAAAYALKP
jgi:hypothetical protein